MFALKYQHEGNKVIKPGFNYFILATFYIFGYLENFEDF